MTSQADSPTKWRRVATRFLWIFLLLFLFHHETGAENLVTLEAPQSMSLSDIQACQITIWHDEVHL